jgi:NhaA family Na+:H+ antiporter
VRVGTLEIAAAAAVDQRRADGLFVGLELKREAVQGAARPRVAALPIAGAAGGVLLPMAVYVAVAWGDAAALRGWAIPAATDIAFAIGVAALLGRHFPPVLRIFLLTLAIVDDLAAILVIAIFYTGDLSATALLVAAVARRWSCSTAAASSASRPMSWSAPCSGGGAKSACTTLAGVALGRCR